MLQERMKQQKKWIRHFCWRANILMTNRMCLLVELHPSIHFFSAHASISYVSRYTLYCSSSLWLAMGEIKPRRYIVRTLPLTLRKSHMLTSKSSPRSGVQICRAKVSLRWGIAFFRATKLFGWWSLARAFKVYSTASICPWTGIE